MYLGSKIYVNLVNPATVPGICIFNVDNYIQLGPAEVKALLVWLESQGFQLSQYKYLPRV